MPVEVLPVKKVLTGFAQVCKVLEFNLNKKSALDLETFLKLIMFLK